MPNPVFTIGHSNHSQECFLSLVQAHAITAVCDVRSKPFSRFSPQFNREVLKSSLSSLGIQYVSLGRELGARSEDPACYLNGRVQYSRLAETALFRSGLERVQNGSRHHRIALLCAEKEPLECHRFILVSRHLAALGLEVQHILADGGLEDHASALIRLARLLNLPDEDLFRSHEDILADAYDLQEARIAFEPALAMSGSAG